MKEITREEIDALWDTIFDIIKEGLPMNRERIFDEAFERWSKFNEE